jgi:GMP synthase (glutamine-hydrolysing)
VSAWFERRGVALDWRAPRDGDALGEPDDDVVATVLYGGGDAVDDLDAAPWLVDEARWVRRCLDRPIPVLGFCLGAQVMALALGATSGPYPEPVHEFGYYEVRPTVAGRAVLPESLHVCQAHFHTFELPVGAVLLASSAAYPHQAFRWGDRAYAFQFHPEITAAGFRQWQDAPWAPYGQRGAQTRAEQDRLAAAHDGAQEAWLLGFLDAAIAPYLPA